ncbi:MAG: DUF2914 domain-containing protein [Gammaproteobacteria bacterium]|nr:DUF2914 domain-containing protein [Gammaproteobacteria bacterium]
MAHVAFCDSHGLDPDLLLIHIVIDNVPRQRVMTGDATTDTIDDTVIEALQPQARRYDVAVLDELVLSVLPNGVKTWTWVFDDPADPHRKTLGIYPDMTLDDARKSLTAEREAYRRASAEVSPEFVIRDGRIEPAEPKSSQLPLIAGAGAAVLVAALAAWLFIGGDDKADPVTADDQTLLKPVDPSAPSIQLPSIDGAATRPAPAVATASSAAENAPETTVDRNAVVSPVADNISTDSDDSAALTAPAADSAGATAPPPATSPPPVSVATDVTAAAADKSNDTLPVTRTQPAAPAEPGAITPAAAIDVQMADATPEPASGDDPVAAATSDVAPTAATSGPVATAGLLLDGRVARGNLTTAVVQREPVDDLGNTLFGNGSDLQQFYFFTELRELAGQRVVHRWVQGDDILAEIPFNVGEAWRWRVYSSKTFIPSMAGDWRVQVALEDGTVIYSLPFTFTP